MSEAPTLIQRCEGGIRFTWPDGHEAVYPYAHLRRSCPCAECRNQPPKVVEEGDPFKLFDEEPIRADRAELVGRYAVQFFWNDGHSHGIYPFDHLRACCPCRDCSRPGRSTEEEIES